MMFVNEIFYSIDGEGLRTGELAVFIRLAGCNLKCSYCDTLYALKKSSGTFMSIDEILDKGYEKTNQIARKKYYDVKEKVGLGRTGNIRLYK